MNLSIYKISLVLFYLGLLLFLDASLYAQQAWTQKKGTGYFQLGSSVLSYSTLHGSDYKEEEIPRPIFERSLSAYCDYGISNKLMATLIIPYQVVSSGDLSTNWQGLAPQKGSLHALGNIDFALSYKVFESSGWVISSRFSLGINSSKSEKVTGLSTGIAANRISPILLIGYGSNKYFSSAEIGINLYSNDYLSRIIFNAQIGSYLDVNHRFLAIIAIRTLTSVGNPSSPQIQLDNNKVYTGLYVNDQSYYSLELKLGYQLAKDWITFFAISGGAAKNIGRNAVYSFSLGYKFGS